LAIDETRAFKSIRIALLTLSDTRTPETDTSGDILAQRITDKGHTIAARMILREDVPALVAQIDAWIDDAQIDCIISTGGTGLTGRDITPEALEQILVSHSGKLIPGFGEVFRYLSLSTIGTSTVQSRAMAIVAEGTYIFALPGSNGAVKDGWDGILHEQLDSRNRPCNFVELMPRLKEV
jgi:molybdenum cofactor biosynthesis protein B